jgi:hypothetical protein
MFCHCVRLTPSAPIVEMIEPRAKRFPRLAAAEPNASN